MVFIFLFILSIFFIYLFIVGGVSINSYYFLYTTVNELSGDGSIDDEFYSSFMSVVYRGSCDNRPKDVFLNECIKKMITCSPWRSLLNSLKFKDFMYIRLTESILLYLFPNNHSRIYTEHNILKFLTLNSVNIFQLKKSFRFFCKVLKDLEEDKMREILGNEVFTSRERPSNMPKILQNRNKYLDHLKKCDNIQRFVDIGKSLPLELVLNDSLVRIAEDLKPFSKGVIDEYFYKNILSNQMVTINPDFYLSSAKIEEYKDDLSAIMLSGLSDIQLGRICRIVNPDFLLVQFKAYFIEDYFENKCVVFREKLKVMQETTSSTTDIAMGDNKIERFNKVLDITFKRMLENRDVRTFLKVIDTVSTSMSMDRRMCDRLVHAFLYDTRKLTPTKLRELFNIDHINQTASVKSNEEIHTIVISLEKELSNLVSCNTMDSLVKYIESISQYSQDLIRENIDSSHYRSILEKKLQWMRDNDVDTIVSGYTDEQLIILNKVAKGKKIDPKSINVSEHEPLLRELSSMFESGNDRRLVLTSENVYVYRENVLDKEVDYKDMMTSKISESNNQVVVEDSTEARMEKVFGKATSAQLKKRDPQYLFFNQVDNLVTDNEKFDPQKPSDIDVVKRRRDILKNADKYFDDESFRREYDRIVKGGWVPNISEVHAPYPKEYLSEKELILATAKRHLYWCKITGGDF